MLSECKVKMAWVSSSFPKLIKNISKLIFIPACICKMILLFHFSQTDLELHRRREQLVERTRREAQLAALQYEEEKIRTKQIQRDAVLDFVKVSSLGSLNGTPKVS